MRVQKVEDASAPGFYRLYLISYQALMDWVQQRSSKAINVQNAPEPEGLEMLHLHVCERLEYQKWAQNRI